MVDQQRQFDKGQTDDIPEALKKMIREFHLAMKRAFLYPVGHPARVRAADEIHQALQELLSAEESHSLTAIEDKLYIDEHKMSADEHPRIMSDEMSTEIARKLRQRGIRSVIFSHGIELEELERFLDIMTMEAKEVMVQNGAGELLRSSGDVPHIEIADIEYESIQFVASDSREGSMDVEEILLSYVKGISYIENLADVTYTYLSSLLDSPDLMARLIEAGTDYDGTSEPDRAAVIRCMDNLIRLGEQFTDEERRDFQRKILDATLRVERPVKNVLFSLSDDSDILTRLMDGLSVDEIANFVAVECTTDEPAVSLRRIFDELLNSTSADPDTATAKRLTQVEAAIQSELVKRGQEDVFDNTVAPVLGEIFAELGSSKLGDDQIRLGSMLDESYSPEQRQKISSSVDEIMDLFVNRDDLVDFAVVLLEMLVHETDFEGYSDTVEQLERTVKSLIRKSRDTVYMRDHYLTTAFHIVDVLFQQANLDDDRSLELQKRDRKAIANIGTEDTIDQALSSLLRAAGAAQAAPALWSALENFIQQIGEKAITPLVENFLDVKNPPERRKLGDILVSMGPMVVSEFHRWLSQGNEVVRQIMPILGKIGESEALELVLSKIRDDGEEESIRRLAISVLGRIGNEQVVEEIERILMGKNTVLKREAIYALGSIGGEKSTSILSDLLNQKRSILRRRRIEELQLQAVEALIQIGTQSAIRVLREMSQRKKGNVKSACEKALEGL